MEKVKIYHNPRCRKSREALQIIEDSNKDAEIIEYLKQPPTKKQLKELIDLLGIKPIDLLRKGENIYKEEYKGKDLSDSEWINAMIKHPILIERPIVVHKNTAVIGRPPQNVKTIL